MFAPVVVELHPVGDEPTQLSDGDVAPKPQLFIFDGFRGNTGFKFGGQVSSFSFHWSYFGLIARVRPANSSTNLWLRFVGPLHFRLVTGWDAEKEELLYHEPATGENGAYRRMKYAELEVLWSLKYKPSQWGWCACPLLSRMVS